MRARIADRARPRRSATPPRRFRTRGVSWGDAGAATRGAATPDRWLRAQLLDRRVPNAASHRQRGMAGWESATGRIAAGQRGRISAKALRSSRDIDGCKRGIDVSVPAASPTPNDTTELLPCAEIPIQLVIGARS
jgi:hypothetical protein